MLLFIFICKGSTPNTFDTTLLNIRREELNENNQTISTKLFFKFTPNWAVYLVIHHPRI